MYPIGSQILSSPNGTGFLWLAVILSSCGYTLQHRLKQTFQNPVGIFIPVFDNQTDEIGAEKYFTEALIRELEAQHEVILSNRKPQSLELHGTLLALDAQPTSFTAFDFKGLQPYRRLPSEYGVRATLRLVLRNDKKEVLWTKDVSSYSRVNAFLARTFDYQAPSSVGPLTQSILDSVYVDIARDLARNVYDEMVGNF